MFSYITGVLQIYLYIFIYLLLQLFVIIKSNKDRL